jgi:hypothetical protein
MAYETLPVRRARHFVPDEAVQLAAELRSIGQETRRLNDRLRSLASEMDAHWEGRAKARIFEAVRGEPGVGEAAAAWLEMQAGRLASAVVTVWETVLERIWVPDP